ncbi:MAG: hypothetical protein CVT92_02315 [Bacteroidetes bacterium HGW-Bacteroidetes-1]|jgi:hypothetical protein|nr:MAG: hypothetical protein CVT92_02315 [Bacteroidetes bacterium HGW-Bacteroidetes-1]
MRNSDVLLSRSLDSIRLILFVGFTTYGGFSAVTGGVDVITTDNKMTTIVNRIPFSNIRLILF